MIPTPPGQTGFGWMPDVKTTKEGTHSTVSVVSSATVTSADSSFTSTILHC